MAHRFLPLLAMSIGCDGAVNGWMDEGLGEEPGAMDVVGPADCARIQIHQAAAIGLYDHCTHADLIEISGADIREIAGFESLETAGRVLVHHNPSLELVEGFGSLRIADELTIHSNDALVAIVGFEGLDKIDGPLVIDDHPAMEDLQALRALRWVNDRLSFRNNERLPRQQVDEVLDRLRSQGYDDEDAMVCGNLDDEPC